MPSSTPLRHKRAVSKRKAARPRRPRNPGKLLRMSSPEDQRTLIDEIDERQETLLHELDSLNARVEALLDECLAARQQERVEAEELEAPANPAGPNVLTCRSLAAAAAPQEC